MKNKHEQTNSNFDIYFDFVRLIFIGFLHLEFRSLNFGHGHLLVKRYHCLWFWRTQFKTVKFKFSRIPRILARKSGPIWPILNTNLFLAETNVFVKFYPNRLTFTQVIANIRHKLQWIAYHAIAATPTGFNCKSKPSTSPP